VARWVSGLGFFFISSFDYGYGFVGIHIARIHGVIVIGEASDGCSSWWRLK